MPRSARKDLYSNFFHVMVQGINKEYIFQKELEIKTYLKYLKEKIEDKNLQVIAYCIMNNHAHFLIYTDDVKEISKLMSQLNTKYAIFYNKMHNRCGFVFRNRYRSEQVFTRPHLISCITYIHNNPVKAGICMKKSDYKYSSYNEYKNNSILLEMDNIIDVFKDYNIDVKDILEEKYEPYKFIEYSEFENKEELKKHIIEDFLKKKNINNLNEIINNIEYLKDLSNLMYIEYNFTQKEIAELLGINRLKIHRLLHEL